METLEITAKTVEEATELALQKLNVGLEEVEVIVLSRGRQGILGIGSEPARVRVIPKTIATSRLAKEHLEIILSHLGINATVVQRETPSSSPGVPPSEATEERPSLVFDIEGEDAGLLIGRKGETLGALQFLVNLILMRRSANPVRVTIDVEGYKARRQESLKNLALQMAERVSLTGRSIAMEPMSPAERRVIHMALANHPRVTTQSVGVGESRKVTLIPRRGKS